MILEVQDVHVAYGEVEVLHGLSLKVEEEKISCIIGPNGSGKSTLFRTIIGFVKPQKGHIFYQGKDISSLSPYQVIEEGIGCVLQGRTAFVEMTVKENLELGGYAIRHDKARLHRNLERSLEFFPVLQEKLNVEAGTLSGGQQQMLEMGRALMLDPDVLLLDEPTLGLAPNVCVEIFELVRELNKEGLTFVIIEQNAQRVLEISDRAFVLDLGRIRMAGDGSSILNNEEVRRLYLGAV